MHSLPTYDHTTSLLEEILEPITYPYLPIYLIDFKVIAHSINLFIDAACQVADGSEEELRRILRAMWAYKLNRGPDMLAPFPFTALIADDCKAKLPNEAEGASSTGSGYWRHIEAHKLDMAEYKGGRGEKTEFFDLIQEEGYRYIKAPGSTFHYFSKDFFEADDIAGHACRLKRNAHPKSRLAKRQIFLGTLDGDWQGLVSDPHGIIWANTGPWLPRLRSEREVCDYYLRKEGMSISRAKGCYDFKVEYGDLGDNLLPGTPLRFFDLYEEDHTWRFDESDTKTLLEILSSTTRSNREDHLASAKAFLLRRGLFLPEIAPTHPEDKRLFFERAQKSRAQNSHPELTGRNRTLCMEKFSNSTVFEKCKELAVKDIETHEEIKKEKIALQQCKAIEDKKCVKELRAILRGLRELRSSLKEQLSQLVNGS